MKTLRSFPYSLSVKGDRERLWNVPWINGSREVLEIMKSLFVEKSFEKNDVFLPLGGSAEFVYFVTSGVVSLEYTKVYEDAPAMGEIYNSDNLEATPEEEFVEQTTRVDYVLAGTMLNVQSVLLGFPRRSRAKCETGVSVRAAQIFVQKSLKSSCLGQKHFSNVNNSHQINVTVAQDFGGINLVEIFKNWFSRFGDFPKKG